MADTEIFIPYNDEDKSFVCPVCKSDIPVQIAVQISGESVDEDPQASELVVNMSGKVAGCSIQHFCPGGKAPEPSNG